MKCDVVNFDCPFEEKSIKFGCKTDKPCCKVGGKEIVCEENKKKFQLKITNVANIFYRGELDGCIEKNNTQKCDYIFFTQDRKKAIFIELKGNDLKKAVDQIEASLKQYPHLGKEEKILCIVSSRGVPAKTSEQSPEHKATLQKWKHLGGLREHISSSKLCLKYDGNIFKKGD